MWTIHSRKWNRCFEQLRSIFAVPQNLELCLLSPRLEVVSCHANRAINRTAGRKLCTSFAISLILSRYNSIRKNVPGQKYIGSDKQVQTTNIFSTCQQSILQQCSCAVLLIGVHFLFISLYFFRFPSLWVHFYSTVFVRCLSLVYAPTSFPYNFIFLLISSCHSYFSSFFHFRHYIIHFLTLLFSELMSHLSIICIFSNIHSPVSTPLPITYLPS